MSKNRNFRNVDKGYDRTASKAEMQALIEDELFATDGVVEPRLATLMEGEAESAVSPPIAATAAPPPVPAAGARPDREPEPRPVYSELPPDGSGGGLFSRLRRYLGL